MTVRVCVVFTFYFIAVTLIFAQRLYNSKRVRCVMSGGAAGTLALLRGVCVTRTLIITLCVLVGALRIKYIIIDRSHTIHTDVYTRYEINVF